MAKFKIIIPKTMRNSFVGSNVHSLENCIKFLLSGYVMTN